MKKLFFSVFLSAFIATSQAFACACGASLNDVATSSLLPNKKGGLMFLQYDYISQNRNLHGSRNSDPGNNHDLKISTKFTTIGTQYMFNRDFGLMLRLPFMDRTVDTTEHEMTMGGHESSVIRTKINTLSDAKIMAIYSGLLDDMSLGLVFGAKLPTGQTKKEDLSANMQAGNGSYEAILGTYYKRQISLKSGFFSQIMMQKPIANKRDYNPGSEYNFALGFNYNLGRINALDKVSPILQIIGSKKNRDSGLLSETDNSGYKRVFIAPAIEVNIGKFKIYSDIELPIYEYVNGQQLSVDKIVKVIVGYNF